MFANTPKPPYYLVSFSSTLSGEELDKYEVIGDRMVKLAKTMPGFLGLESVRDPKTGFGVTISYWSDKKSILNWKTQHEHKLAQQLGKEVFYSQFKTRIAKVEKAYSLYDHHA